MEYLVPFWSLGWEDPLEEGVATHPSILAWRIPWTEPGGLQSIGTQSQTWLSDLVHMHSASDTSSGLNCREHTGGRISRWRRCSALWAEHTPQPFVTCTFSYCPTYPFPSPFPKVMGRSSQMIYDGGNATMSSPSESFSRSLDISSVQSLRCVWLLVAPWTAAHQASLAITTPRACSNSCPLSQWCHLAISSSVIPFSSCLQSIPVSGSFPMNQFFTSGGQNIGISASASVLPMNIQDWFPLGLIGWISLQSKGLSREFSNTIVQKHQFFGAQLSL